VTELLLNVAELLRKPGAERQLQLESTIEALGIDDPRLPAGPVAVDARLEALSDGVVVHGTVTARGHGECRRCLSRLEGPFEVTVHELYQVRITDPDAFPLEHDQLDLRPMVREALLLDAPVNPLCRDDCAGICPTCGIDRNTAACSCEVLVTDDRWAALDALRDDSR